MNGGLNTYGYVGQNPIFYSDPKGLVVWKGWQKEVGAAVGIGGSISIFELTSDCVDGKQVTVTIIAVGPSIGLSGGFKDNNLPFNIGGTPTEFEDNLSTPDPNNFNGIYSNIFFGATVLPYTAGIQVTVLGHAGKKGLFTYGWAFGLGGGYQYTFGSSTVVNSTESNCEC